VYRQFFAALDSPALPLAAMGFFLVAFVLMLARTFLWKRKSDYDPIAALPLDDPEGSDRHEVKP
jgi:hypothetical protein